MYTRVEWSRQDRHSNIKEKNARETDTLSSLYKINEEACLFTKQIMGRVLDGQKKLLKNQSNDDRMCRTALMFLDGILPGEEKAQSDEQEERLLALAGAVDALQESLLMHWLLITTKSIYRLKEITECILNGYKGIVAEEKEEVLRGIVLGMADHMLVEAYDRTEKYAFGKEYTEILKWYFEQMKLTYIEQKCLMESQTKEELIEKLQNVWKEGGYKSAYRLGQICRDPGKGVTPEQQKLEPLLKRLEFGMKCNWLRRMAPENIRYPLILPTDQDDEDFVREVKKTGGCGEIAALMEECIKLKNIEDIKKAG